MTGASDRSLTPGEIALARSIFGDAIDYAPVRLAQRKWAFFQPRETVMAPTGCIHFHPKGTRYCHDFATGDLDAQGLLIHELTHIWQTQRGLFLPLVRHPFCHYDYAVRTGWPLKRYGIEQQAEIVRHAFVLRRGGFIRGAMPLATLEGILPF